MPSGCRGYTQTYSSIFLPDWTHIYKAFNTRVPSRKVVAISISTSRVNKFNPKTKLVSASFCQYGGYLYTFYQCERSKNIVSFASIWLLMR